MRLGFLTLTGLVGAQVVHGPPALLVLTPISASTIADQTLPTQVRPAGLSRVSLQIHIVYRGVR